MSKQTANAIAERRSHSLSGLVRDELERQILAGEFVAGERVNEQAVATRLGVSRGPVREAARRLERDGLVTCIPNHGVFVRQLSIDEAVELYDLRAIVVGYACGRLAGTATAFTRAELEDLIRRMSDAAAAEDAAGYYELNLRFHDRLMALSGCPRSADLYQSLVKEAHLFRRRSLMTPAAMAESNGEHARILAAIAAGDAAAAREAAERHHLNGKRRWLETLAGS